MFGAVWLALAATDERVYPGGWWGPAEAVLGVLCGVVALISWVARKS